MRTVSNNNNKVLGNQFEVEFCEELKRRGWWVCRMAPNASGQQPMDVLAIRDGRAKMIDCKVVTGQRFPLSRIEDNQRSSAWWWETCGNGEAWFAFKVGDDESADIWMVPMNQIDALIQIGRKSFRTSELPDLGYDFETWWED